MLPRNSFFAVASCLCLVFFGRGVANSQDFTQFRGTGGRGVAAKSNLPANWTVDENLVWKNEIDGAGWSQPVVWKDNVYVTTAVAANDLKPKNFAGGVRQPQSMGMGGKKPDFEVTWQVVCLDLKTGKKKWATKVKSEVPKHAVHPSNTYATESPAVDADGVYAYFGANGAVVGLDHGGKIRWQKDVGAFKTNNDFGTGSSVAISKGKIFVQVLTEESAKVFCFGTLSGDQKWVRKREGKGSSWSTPVVWDNDQRSELIVSGGMQITSYGLDAGELLWKLDKVKSPTACSVAADKTKIYFGGSDPMSKGPLFAMTAGAAGEIQPKRTNQTFAFCAWRNPRSAPGMSSPISNGDLVYVVDRSVLRTYDAETGEEAFEKQRLPGFKMVVACPVIAGDELILIDEYGAMGAVKVGDQFSYRRLGSVEDTVWASPAVTKDAILVRGVSGLYCIGRKPAGG